MFGKMIFRGACIAVLLLGLGVSSFAQGNNPVIIIPGLTGSELVNKKTGETVWFKVSKSKVDDLKLPISTNLAKNHDSLVPGDILRGVKIGILPKFDVYGGLVQSLIDRDGYHEESWELPSPKGAESAIYVFPYDWRLDNVENARLLVRRITALKLKLKKPNLKFDIIAHSMGGIISRYAAMYGDADLPLANKKPVPTWAGGKLFDKMILMGTPNEGSALSLNPFLNGMRLGGLKVDLPFIRNLSKFDIFTIPSGYQLLPAPGTLRAFDENLAPLDIDLYDPKVWTKYGWNPITDANFASNFSLTERRAATAYFALMLSRAKRLQQALAAGAPDSKSGVSIALVGSDCKDVLDSILIIRDRKTDRWKVLFKPTNFIRSDGQKVKAEDLKTLMLAPGDGTVTRRSFEASTLASNAKVDSILHPASSKFVCEEHDKLQTNIQVQDYIMSLLNVKTVPEITADPVVKTTRQRKNR